MEKQPKEVHNKYQGLIVHSRTCNEVCQVRVHCHCIFTWTLTTVNPGNSPRLRGCRHGITLLCSVAFASAPFTQQQPLCYCESATLGSGLYTLANSNLQTSHPTVSQSLWMCLNTILIELWTQYSSLFRVNRTLWKLLKKHFLYKIQIYLYLCYIN